MSEAELHDFQGEYRGVLGPAQVWRWLVERVWAVEHAFERARTSGRVIDSARMRIFLFLALFGFAFVFLCVEATKAALFNHAETAGLEAPTPAAARADLVDRNGALLAVDLTHFGLYLDPRQVWDAKETRAGLLRALPRVSADRLDKALASGRREYLVGALTPQEKERVHDLGLPGVTFEEEAKRVYPLGATAAHLIGFTDAGGRGLAGAEKALDGPIHAAASPGGAPVALALDLRVQAALQDEVRDAALTFSAIGGAGIVADAHTGEILGMTSWPSIDANEPGAGGVAPMTNHAAATVYELGSVFKIFTVAMGLDQGLATVDTMFDVRHPLTIGNARPIHDHEKGDTTLSLAQVFTHSSNIGAAKLALKAGPARVNDYFRRFGLMSAAPSEMLESARPLVPSKLSELTVANMAFGQGISVSPLAMATAMAPVFNGGTAIPLTIRKLGPGEHPRGRRVLSEATSRTMLDLMRQNVIEGSGKKANALGLRVGGKTGSAQKVENGRYGRNNVSSFAAVFPTDGPLEARRYIVLITLDSPQATKDTFGFITAGWNAAPTAGRVIDRIAPFLGVARVATTPFAPPAPGKVVDGKGMHD